MAWENILSDAIKILGPAIITGIVGYMGARIQYKLKLEELKESHEFGAREHIFKVHTEKMKDLRESHRKVSEALGKITGMYVGVENESELRLLREGMQMLQSNMISELRSLKKEMERHELVTSPEFAEIDSSADNIRNLRWDGPLTQLHENVNILMETLDHARYCRELLLEQRSGKILDKYLT